MRTTRSVEISRTADEVYAFLADVRHEVAWRSSIVGSRFVGTTVPAVGVRGETDVEMGSRALTMRWVVTVADADARTVAWTLDGDPWDGGGSYAVREHTGGCVVTASLEVRLHGVARVLEPVVGAAFRRGLRADLARLVAVLEAPPADLGSDGAVADRS